VEEQISPSRPIPWCIPRWRTWHKERRGCRVGAWRRGLVEGRSRRKRRHKPGEFRPFRRRMFRERRYLGAARFRITLLRFTARPAGPTAPIDRYRKLSVTSLRRLVIRNTPYSARSRRAAARACAPVPVATRGNRGKRALLSAFPSTAATAAGNFVLREQRAGEQIFSPSRRAAARGFSAFSQFVPGADEARANAPEVQCPPPAELCRTILIIP